ncbi:glycosyltransferase [Kaistella faecalis]|uniref:glycosyltransferase n=1 Tax=Kaistella faecalis TaxID=2852098 RepID=UPI001C470FE5|nr:glycosyltransferase [Chryseobacterium faecale]UFK97122.1 glycosyltransferase [Chryseobacterium faecale]
MNNNPAVRIVILNYNESSYTIDLVKQLEKQTYPSLEVVVVDNASRTQEKEILNHLPAYVIKLFSEENLGYARGNNLGIVHKTGKRTDYHLILNNDLILDDEDFVKKLVHGMIMHPEVAASSPLVDTVAVDEPLEEQIQVRRILSADQMFKLSVPLFTPFIKKLTRYFLYRDQMPFVNKYIHCDSINGAAFIIDAKFIEQYGSLDEGTFLYYEEVILGRKILEANKKCLLNGYTSVKHLQGVSTNSNAKNINRKMEVYKYQSALYYLKKYENIGMFKSSVFVILNEISILLKKLLK